MIKVTIGIPCYNVEKYIDKCLMSLINQTLEEKYYKIVAVDDGSTDNTLEILRSYELKYPDLIQVISQKNIGQGKTRNKIIGLVESKYLMFIDSDDYVKNDYIESLLVEIESSNLDIVNSGFIKVNSDYHTMFEVKSKNTIPNFIFIGNMWGKIYRVDFLRENQLSCELSTHGEDLLFNMLALQYAPRFSSIEYDGYYWFYNDSSTTSKQRTDEMIINDYVIFFEKLTDLKKNEYSFSIILYATLYLFSAKVSRENFLRLHKKIYQLSRKRLTKTDYLKNIFCNKRGLPLNTRLAVDLYCILTLTHTMRIFSSILQKIREKVTVNG